MLRRSTFCHCAGQRFDVAVIGAGPSGIAAALRAADYGKSVCLIEKSERLGGADVWNGALQSKTMWEATSFVQRVRATAPKVFTRDVQLGQMQVCERRIQTTLQSVAEARMAAFKEALREAKVTVEHGLASFVDKRHITVTPATASASAPAAKKVIEADHFIIATGSKPRVHPQIAFDGDTVVSSDEVMQLSFPKRMLIVGSGVIGMEFGGMFGAVGTKVNMIEKAPRVLPNEDEDIALLIQDLMIAQGTTFHHRRQLKDIAVVHGAGGKTVRYTLQSLDNPAQEEMFEVDRTLISIGRVPQYDGLNLEAAGIQLSKRGGIASDEWGCCKLLVTKEEEAAAEAAAVAAGRKYGGVVDKHIYCVGDATLDIALVNKGEREAAAAVNRMFYPDHEGVLSLSNLSTIMFLAEEVAGVGLSEEQCRARNISYIVAKYSYDHCVRSMLRLDPVGFVKVIVSNDEKKTVLGVRAVGAHASSIIELASLAVHRKSSAYELSDLSCAYPSQAVALMECVRMLIGRSLFKPECFEGLSVRTWIPPHFERGRAYQGK
jgi:dihydrolipoamide dehydrogenase